MESTAGLLRTFYDASSSPEARKAAHEELVNLLRNPQSAEAAATYIRSLSPSSTIDPLVLHYAIHCLEELARTSYDKLAPSARSVTQELLLRFVIQSYAASLSSTPAASRIPAHAILKAAHACAAFGRREIAADTFANPTSFITSLLTLIDSDGPPTTSLPRMLGGVSVLCILVDEALDSSHASLPASHLRALRQRVQSRADHILPALEVGLRICGPGVPMEVPLGAARSISGIVRAHPPLASAASEILRRGLQGARVDAVAAEMLCVLAELFSEPNVPLRGGACKDALEHCALLMERVAMGDVAKGNTEELCVYRARLIGYVDAVLKRIVGYEPPVQALERALNALMGCTLQFATSASGQFPAALDAWMNLLEAMEDADMDLNHELLQRAFTALSRLCVERCMYRTNAGVLRQLDEDDDAENDDLEQVSHDVNGALQQVDAASTLDERAASRTVSQWESAADLAAQLGADASNISSSITYIASSISASTSDSFAEGDGIEDITRGLYVAKCVDALIVLARSAPQQVAFVAVEFACEALAKVPSTLNSAKSSIVNANGNDASFAVNEENLKDFVTACNIAQAVAQQLPPESPVSYRLLEITISVLQSATASSTESPFLASLIFAALRVAAVLSRSFAVRTSQSQSEQPHTKAALAERLCQICAGLLTTASAAPRRVHVVATLVLLVMERTCSTTLFEQHPPFDNNFFNLHLPASPRVSALASAGIVQWAVIADRDAGGKVGAGISQSSLSRSWEPKRLAVRAVTYRELCRNIFAEFAATANHLKASASQPAPGNGMSMSQLPPSAQLVALARAGALLRVMSTVARSESRGAKDALWNAAIAEATSCAVDALIALDLIAAQQQQQGHAEELSSRSAFLSTLAALISGVGASLRAYGTLSSSNEICTRALGVTLRLAERLGAARLGRALLRLLLDRLCDADLAASRLLAPAATELSSRALESSSKQEDASLHDPDVASSAISVLAEVLSRHWNAFWPGDAVGGVARDAAASKPSLDRTIFFRGLRALIDAVRCIDASVSRDALLALESLDAARKLFSRPHAFAEPGAAAATASAALAAIADPVRTAIVAEDAASVMWGVARGDLKGFCEQVLPTAVSELLGDMQSNIRNEICQGFAKDVPQNRNEFVRKAMALANDCAYLLARHGAPTL